MKSKLIIYFNNTKVLFNLNTMGNTLQVDKIVNIMTELSETTDMNEKFLIKQFNALNELTNENNTPYETIRDLFIKFTQNLDNENIVNFANNLLSFIQIQSKDDLLILQSSLLYFSCLIESIYAKHCDLKHIMTFSVQNIKEQSVTNLSLYFPFSILSLSISIINDNDFFLKPFADKNKFELLYYLINVIYHIIAYPLNVGSSNKTILEYINLFKYIFFNESFIKRDQFELFFKKIFSIFSTNFDSLIQYNQNSSMSKKETIVSMLFSIMMFFCWDINQFFFGVNEDTQALKTEVICCFENEYNTLVYNFLIKIFQTDQLNQIVLDYKKFYQEELINLLHYNSQLFTELIVIIFNNYEAINPLFFKQTCIFFICIFESAPNFLEMLSMKEYIIAILSKLSLMSLEEVIFVNRVITSNNFISLIKQIQEDEDNESIKIIEKVLVTSVDLIKNDECPNCLILYLYMIISNISLFIVKINKRFIAEFVVSFKELMVNKANIKSMSHIDKCILINLFIEISFNFINNNELTSLYLLSLIKIADELINVYSLIIQNVQLLSLFNQQERMIKLLIESTNNLYKRLNIIIDKVKKKVVLEGADVTFSQDCVVSLNYVNSL